MPTWNVVLVKWSPREKLLLPLENYIYRYSEECAQLSHPII